MEFALLVDTAQHAGLDAVAQVDLGERRHRHQGDQSLGIKAAEIWRIALDRLDPGNVVSRPGDSIAEFTYGPEGVSMADHVVDVLVRPPLAEQRERSGQGAQPRRAD